MRTRQEIEYVMSKLKNRFATTYGKDDEASIRIYVRYRELYWVLHPEIDDDTSLAHAVNSDLQLQQLNSKPF